MEHVYIWCWVLRFVIVYRSFSNIACMEHVYIWCWVLRFVIVYRSWRPRQPESQLWPWENPTISASEAWSKSTPRPITTSEAFSTLGQHSWCDTIRIVAVWYAPLEPVRTGSVLPTQKKQSIYVYYMWCMTHTHTHTHTHTKISQKCFRKHPNRKTQHHIYTCSIHAMFENER